jgi:hypothetical protein
VYSAGSPSGAAYKQNYLKKDMLARAGEQYQNKSFMQDEVSLAGTRWVCLLSAHLYRRQQLQPLQPALNQKKWRKSHCQKSDLLMQNHV